MNKKITLKELLKSNKFENGVCIGSKTSFFYIGEANFDAINEELKKYYANVQKTITSNTKILRTLVINGINKELYSDQELDEKVQNKIEAIYAAYNSIKTCNMYLNNFEDLEKRIVIDTRTRTFDGKTVIIISGNENGSLWFENEGKVM